MAATTLVAFPLEEGRKLAEAVDKIMPLKAAFWLYFDDGDEWRLVLASPIVDTDGPRRVYGRIDEVLTARSDLAAIHLWNVSALSPRDPTVKAVIEGLADRPLGDGLLLRNSRVGGKHASAYVEGAYVYFVRP